MELTDWDVQVLATLGRKAQEVATLAAGLDVPAATLRDRLAELAENGLVTAVEDGRYRRTESGRRVVETSSGTHDVDTPPAVEETLAELSLSPPEQGAVRQAFTFLRFRGRATADEFVDAVYSERSAGYESPEAWWTECVSEPLASLPVVEPPTTDDGVWHYTGPRGVTAQIPDGRRYDRDEPDGRLNAT